MSGKLKVLFDEKTVSYLRKIIKMDKEFLGLELTEEDALENCISNFHDNFYSGVWEYIENREEIPELEKIEKINADINISKYFYFSEAREILFDYYFKSLSNWWSSENIKISYSTLLRFIVKDQVYGNYHFYKKSRSSKSLKDDLEQEEKDLIKQIDYLNQKLEEVREKKSKL